MTAQDEAGSQDSKILVEQWPEMAEAESVENGWDRPYILL